MPLRKYPMKQDFLKQKFSRCLKKLGFYNKSKIDRYKNRLKLYTKKR